jgi:AmmeMemoRadiSam system protein B
MPRIRPDEEVFLDAVDRGGCRGAARGLDAATEAAIEALAPERIGDQRACGRIPIAGLLLSARARGLRAVTADLRNSGDTAGPHGEVVGYGAFLLA